MAEVAPRYTDLLSTSNIKFVQGNVGKIDTYSREIEYITYYKTLFSVYYFHKFHAVLCVAAADAE